MPALPSIVSTYIDGLIDDLQQGSPLDLLDPPQTHAAGVNFLRAMDIATALELLQNALYTGVMTATGGSSTTVVDGASTFVANQQVGNYVEFASNTTTVALRSTSARVISNTTTTLTFATGALAGTPVVGDTYRIRGGFLNEEIAYIRGGKAIGQAVIPGYADRRLVTDAIVKMYSQLGGTVNNLKQTVANLRAGTGGTTTAVVVNVSSTGIGKNMRVDEYKNMEVTVASLGTCVVSHNDEDTLYLRSPLTGAPTAADAVTIRNPQMTSTAGEWALVAFSGGHPNNVLFGDLLDRLKTLIVAYTLPT